MRIVAALGGNALLSRGEQPDDDVQEHHVADAAAALAPVARRHELIVTHGDGHQQESFALESADDANPTRTYPLDALDAQTQALIGYWLVEALQRELPDHKVACLLTRTLVDADDPTLPLGLVEGPIIERLLAPNVVIVCSGGGGGPVVDDPARLQRGVEALVDKDLTAAVLAEQVGADRLLLLTDVAAVMEGWGTAAARPIGRAGVAWFRRRAFAAGSMGPKIDAACRFVQRTGRPAAIGALGQVDAIVAGRAGTEVTATQPAIV